MIIKKATLILEPNVIEHVIHATAEFTLVKVDHSTIRIKLNCDSCKIEECKINSVPSQWKYHQFFYQTSEFKESFLQLHSIECYDLYHNAHEKSEVEINVPTSSTEILLHIKYQIVEFETIIWTKNDLIFTAETENPHHWMPCFPSHFYPIEIFAKSNFEVIQTALSSDDFPLYPKQIGFVLFSSKNLHKYHQSPISSDPTVVVYSSNRERDVEIANLLQAVDYPKLFWHIEKQLDFSIPFDQFQLVFLDSNEIPFKQNKQFGNLLFCSTQHLFTARMIDEIYISVPIFVEQAVYTFLSYSLQFQTPQDEWISICVCSWITNLYLETLFGRLFVEAEYLKLVQVVDTLTQRDSLNVITKFLSHLVGRTTMESVFKDLITYSEISTSFYFQLLRKHSHVSDEILEEFIEKYLQPLQSGQNARDVSPTIMYYFDSRNKYVKLEISHTAVSEKEKKSKKRKLVVKEEEQSTEVRCQIHEVTRSAEYFVELSNATTTKSTLPCQSSVLRNRKRKHLSIQQQLQLSIDKLFSRLNSSPIRYLRFDAQNCVFLGLPKIKTSLMMLLQQLFNERDYKGQFEAVYNIGNMFRAFAQNKDLKYPKFIITGFKANCTQQNAELTEMQLCEHVLKHILVHGGDRFQWQIRQEVIYVLTEFPALHHIILEYFNSVYIVFPLSANKILKPNDFNNFINYFLKCSVIRGFSRSAFSGEKAVEFLWFVDQESLNNGNNYDDAHYRGAIMEAWGNVALCALATTVSNEWKAKIVARLQHVYDFECAKNTKYNKVQIVATSALNSLLQWKFQFASLSQINLYSFFANKLNGSDEITWKWCLMWLAIDYEGHILLMTKVLENMYISKASHFVEQWIEAYRIKKLDPAPSRINSKTNQEFMHRLWVLLLKQTVASKLATLLRDLYALLWSGDRFNNFLTKENFSKICGMKIDFEQNRDFNQRGIFP
jgi:hypothetical protein